MPVEGHVMSCFCALNRTSFVFLWPSEQVDGSQITDVWRLFLDGHLKTQTILDYYNYMKKIMKKAHVWLHCANG